MSVTVVRLPVTPPDQRGFGRHVEHDDESVRYAFSKVASLPTRPVEWTHTKPVLNQLNYNACVGNAFAQFLNCDFGKPVRDRLGKSWFTQSDALDIYAAATHRDGLHNSHTGYFRPDDDGSSGLGGAKACQQLGYIRSYQHTFSFVRFQQALATQPVLVGTSWTETMQDTDADGLLEVGILDEYTTVGGHEYLAVGLDPHRKLIKFLNSWGPGWGVKGFFYITYDDFHRLLLDQGDVIVPRLTLAA